MHLTLVAAIAENRVIGVDGDMPWHYPEDLKHFRETTLGSPVIMGRVTYESIREKLDGPFDGRYNIILSTSLDEPDAENATVVDSIPAAVEAASERADAAYVVGGANVYEQFLDRDLIDQMVLTLIPEKPDGDTLFPEYNVLDWEQIDRQETDELVFSTLKRQ